VVTPPVVPPKLVLEGAERTEATGDFQPTILPPGGPLTEAQRALIAPAQVRVLELAAADHMPPWCDGKPAAAEAVADVSTLAFTASENPPGQLAVTFFVTGPTSEWLGQGCCAPCADPCGSCGYCSPADACQHFVTERQLEVSYVIDAMGKALSEKIVRRAAARREVLREVIIPAPGPRAGVVTVGKPEVPPGFEGAEKLAAYLRSRAAALRYCIEREASRANVPNGEIVLSFSIAPNGRLTDIEISKDTLKNEDIPVCLKAVVQGLVFPFKPDADVPVVLPIVFTQL
jgi:hypothetical protein